MCWVHLSSFLPFYGIHCMVACWWHVRWAMLCKVRQNWAMLSTCLILPSFALFLDNFDRQADPSAAPQEVGRCVLQERFCLGHGTFQAVGAAWPSLSQFGFRCEDLRASIQSIYPFQYTHTCIFIIYKYILVKGSLDVQTPWCRKYGQESRGQKKGRTE